MLALLERAVTDAGGNYVFCDTDSMGIVADRSRRAPPLPGRSERRLDGQRAVQALSCESTPIVDRFAAAQPLRPRRGAGSILKSRRRTSIDRGRRWQLWCWAISAKRYVLYTLGRDGPVLDHSSTLTTNAGPSDDPGSPRAPNTASAISSTRSTRHPHPRLHHPSLGVPAPPGARLPVSTPAGWTGRPSPGSPSPAPRCSAGSTASTPASRTPSRSSPPTSCSSPTPTRSTPPARSRSPPTTPTPHAGRSSTGSTGTGQPARITTQPSDGHPRLGVVRVRTYGERPCRLPRPPGSERSRPRRRARRPAHRRAPTSSTRQRYSAPALHRQRRQPARRPHDRPDHCPADYLNEYLDPARTIWSELVVPVLRTINHAYLQRQAGLHRRSIDRYLNNGVTPEQHTEQHSPHSQKASQGHLGRSGAHPRPRALQARSSSATSRSGRTGRPAAGPATFPSRVDSNAGAAKRAGPAAEHSTQTALESSAARYLAGRDESQRSSHRDR